MKPDLSSATIAIPHCKYSIFYLTQLAYFPSIKIPSRTNARLLAESQWLVISNLLLVSLEFALRIPIPTTNH